VHQSDGITIVLPDPVQKRDELAGVFRGNFYIAQHNLGLSNDLNIATGEISSLADITNDRSLLQISAPIQQGSSGGPILDRSGNVAGVVVSKLNAVAVAAATGDIPQNINFAISGDALKYFLRANNISFTSQTSSSPSEVSAIAKEARSYTHAVECEG